MTARAFRGVRDEMVIDAADGRSLVVLGPNATGKSTITDALEWFFTGELKLLSREGREAGIRHLGAMRTTEVLVSTDGVLGGTSTYGGLASATRVGVGRSETFILRGSALVDFMDKTKGEKWKALAEILGLEEVDRLRLDLQTAAHELQGADELAAREFVSAARPFIDRGIDPTDETVLQTLRTACRTAGVAEPNSLTEVREPAWAAVFGAASTATRTAIALGSLAGEIASAAATANWEGELDRWNRGVVSPTAPDRPRLTFIGVAESYLRSSPTPGKCPLCGQAVQDEVLVAHVSDALKGLRAAAEEVAAMDAAFSRLDRLLESAFRKREGLHTRAEQLGVAVNSLPTSSRPFLAAARSAKQLLAPEIIRKFLDQLYTWDRESLERVKATEQAVAGQRNKQLVEAGTLREQAVRWVEARENFGRARLARDLAQKVFDAYQKSLGEYFEDVLAKITNRVGAIYQRLHPDEHIDKARVELAGDKGIEVAATFHGHDQKPPHGVLSESHLNSLGLALFLAMAEAFNQRLGFLVLDDVVNSFDGEHRGRLADLLASDYEAWQVFVLTHDRQFFQHLIRRAPSWHRLEYTSWSFDDGPRTSGYEPGDLLRRAQGELSTGNLDGAARTARRALEEFLQEACEGLEALLPFRRGAANDQREIGEVLPGLRRVLKDAAPKRLGDLKDLLLKIDADVGAVLNVETHASVGWSSSGEIEDAIKRIDALAKSFTCVDCGTRVWHRGTADACRCRCGKSVFP